MAANEWSMVPPDINAVMGVIDAQVRWNNENEEERFYDKYHPSAFGKCLRKMQYQRYEALGLVEGKKETFDSKTLRLFGKGHNMHSRWASYFEAAAVLRGKWRCINPFCQKIYGKDELQGIYKPSTCECGSTVFEYMEVTVESKELNMRGHADLVIDFSQFDLDKYKGMDLLFKSSDLPKEIVVADMKTCKDRIFEDILRNGPHFAYQIQLTIYANILDCGYGMLIYENKDDSRTAAFKIDKNTDTIFASIQRQAKLMNEMVDDKLLPPPRPSRKDSYECRYCQFSSVCRRGKIWSDENLEAKRTKFYGSLLRDH